MSSASPAKSRWGRIGGVVRRASTAFTAPRSSSSSIASVERDSDVASIKGSVRSIPFTSALAPTKPVISHPSPIPESPVQQNDAEAIQTIVTPSPLAQVPVDADPEAIASPVNEYTPPPLIDSTAAINPGGFTDEPDELPQPTTIRDPSRAPSLHEPVIEPTTVASSDAGDSLPLQVIEPSSIQQKDASAINDTQPQVIDSAAGAPGSFNDDLDLSQPHVEDATRLVPPSRLPTPKLSETVVSQNPGPISGPEENGAYFDLTPHDKSAYGLTIESVQQLDGEVRVTQPADPAQEPGAVHNNDASKPLYDAGIPTPVLEPADIPMDDQHFKAMPIMPIPEPAAVPTIIPIFVPSPHDAYTSHEVWGEVQSPQPPLEQATNRDVNASAPYTSRSRASSIHTISGSSENPFADPIAPRITVSHHGQATPPPLSMPMPQPQILEAYQQTLTGRVDPPPVVIMPLPHAHEVIPSRSIYNASSQTLPGTVTGYHEIDERVPLLSHGGSLKVTSYLQPEPSTTSRNIVNVSPLSSGIPFPSAWPTPAAHQGPRLHDFGWIEYQLPDSTVYYVHPTRRVTADIDLRDERRLEFINGYFESHRDGAGAPAGTELWLLQDGEPNGRRAFGPPVRYLVNHRQRLVTVDHSALNVNGSAGVKAKARVDDDQLDIEYRYWSFVEAHPAHTTLPPSARAEAMDALTWAWTDRLLPLNHDIPGPFSQEECQELMSLLRSFEQNEGGLQTVVHTRVVARILLRVAAWRQKYFRPNKPLPTDVGHHEMPSKPSRSFGRALVDFVISCLCLGIPYLFFERSRQSRIDEESGTYNLNPGPMVIVGTCACLTAAIILSASVTFLSLPGLDNFSRIAGFVAVLFAIFSMVSTLVALFHFKAEMDNPISHVAGEGLRMITQKRSVVMSLPLVLLVYAMIAFVTGIILYSFRGVTEEGLFEKHPFDDYTKWTVIGVLGGLGGMLLTSLLVLRR